MSDIIIYIPENHLNERTYIIESLFSDFIDVPIIIKKHEKRNYIININDNLIEVKSSFFDNNEGYIKRSSIPNKTFDYSSSIINIDLVGIYGENIEKVEDNYIYCGLDIFASSFFMLTRWEEIIHRNKDDHLRFRMVDSLAYKNNFIDRPVVNEYVYYLKKLFSHFNFEVNNNQNYTIIPTHDIDIIKPSYKLKTFLGDIIKRKSLEAFFARGFSYFSGNNPYNCFELLMDLSERYNRTSRFYFMTGGSSNYDNHYSIKDEIIQNAINAIKNREHIIGFHPSYNSYNDFSMWSLEKRILEKSYDIVVEEGRQHILRFENPLTLQIWNENLMKTDSTLGFAESIGFRCGTGNRYKCFDLENNISLNIYEQPLVIMDATLKNYQKLSIKKAKKNIQHIKNVCKKWNTPCTVLFHNSSFDNFEWKGWKEVYIECLI